MSPTAPNEHPGRWPSWDDTSCIFQDCEEPRAPGRKFCARHAAEADEAAKQQREQDRAAGWSPMESTDA